MDETTERSEDVHHLTHNDEKPEAVQPKTICG